MFKQILILLFVSLIAGCASNMSNPFKVTTTGHFFGEPTKDDSRVLQYVLNRVDNSYIPSASEEKLAQSILSNNKNQQFTKWNDPRFGELSMAPTSRYLRDGRLCRGYRVEYWFVGTFRTKQGVPGVSCKEKTGPWLVVQY